MRWLAGHGKSPTPATRFSSRTPSRQAPPAALVGSIGPLTPHLALMAECEKFFGSVPTTCVGRAGGKCIPTNLPVYLADCCCSQPTIIWCVACVSTNNDDDIVDSSTTVTPTTTLPPTLPHSHTHPHWLSPVQSPQSVWLVPYAPPPPHSFLVVRISRITYVGWGRVGVGGCNFDLPVYLISVSDCRVIGCHRLSSRDR